MLPGACGTPGLGCPPAGLGRRQRPACTPAPPGGWGGWGLQERRGLGGLNGCSRLARQSKRSGGVAGSHAPASTPTPHAPCTLAHICNPLCTYATLHCRLKPTSNACRHSCFLKCALPSSFRARSWARTAGSSMLAAARRTVGVTKAPETWITTQHAAKKNGGAGVLLCVPTCRPPKTVSRHLERTLVPRVRRHC